MLPLVRRPNSQFHDEFDSVLLQPLKAVLQQHNIFPEIRLENLQSQAQPSAKTHTYVLVIADWTPDCQEIWKAAADALIDEIRELGYGWLKVVIADDRAMFSPRTAGLDSDDSLTRAWPLLSDEILDAIDPNRSWLTLNLFWRWKEWNHGQDEKKINVVLLIDWNSEEDWDQVISNIKGVIARHPTCRSRNVGLEVIRGYLFGGLDRAFNFEDPPAIGHNENLFSSIPYLGASICPGNGVGAGSFGCTLQLDDQPGLYGLTACHVVLPSSNTDETYADPSAQQYIDPRLVNLLRTGATLDDLPSRPVLRMPAETDLQALKKFCEEQIAEEQAYLDGKLNFAQRMVESGLESQVSPTTLHQLVKCKESIEGFESTKSKATAALNDPDTTILGEVRAFSGFRKSDKTDATLDWALVSLPGFEAHQENKLPSKISLRNVRSECLDGFEDLISEQTAYKIGRSTGLTAGKVSSGWSRMRDPSTRVWATELKPDSEGTRNRLSASSVRVIIPFGSDRFAGPGDSGSVVFNISGAMQGMLVASSHSGHEAYVTPVSDLLEDIKALTGAKEVSFPKPT